MACRFKTFLLVAILTFFLFSSGVVEGSKEGMHPKYSLDQVGQVNSRKLLMYNTVMDYDDTGANPKHDPRRKPPGGGAHP